MLVGRRLDQRQLAFFRQHKHQVLIGQEDELTMAVASTLPFAAAVLQVDACQNTTVEAKCIAVVNNEIVEVGL